MAIDTTDDVSWLTDPEIVAATLGIYKGTVQQFTRELDEVHRKHPEIDFKKVFAGALKVLDRWEAEEAAEG